MTKTKSNLDLLREATISTDLHAATALIHSCVTHDPATSLRYIREKELLLLPRSATFRDALRNSTITALTRMDPDGLLLQPALPYLAYCDIVASVRDELAAYANNEAQALASLPPETYIELCAVAVTDLVRRYVALQPKEASTTDPATHSRAGTPLPGELVDAVWEISGTYALLPLMLLEVGTAARAGATRRPLSTLDAARAAQRLCRIAEDWQLLTDIRQRVAWQRDNVARVEPEWVQIPFCTEFSRGCRMT